MPSNRSEVCLGRRGPRGVPLLGSLLEFGSDPLSFFTRCAHDYGDCVAFRLGRRPAFLLNHPDLIEQVLLADRGNFKKYSFFWRHTKRVAEHGLLVLEGEAWRCERRLLQPAFHHERIKAYGELMVGCAERITATWQPDTVIAIDQEMRQLTGHVVTQTLFGTDVMAEIAQIRTAFDSINAEITRRFRNPVYLPDWIPTPRNRRFQGAIAQLDNFVYGIIRKRRETASASNDLLSMLLQARYENGGRLTDAQLRDEIVTFFLAGHETTALALSWAWYLMALHPKEDERVVAEIRTVLKGRPPSAAAAEHLRHVEHVLLETMRLYPPAYVIGREAMRDCKLDGYSIPAGATVFMSPWVMHRDLRYFEDPQAFHPARWDHDQMKRIPRYAYFPFGGGPRICIGNTFAMMEGILLLATIAQNFRFELLSEHPVTPDATVTLRPRYGIKMRLSRR